MKKITMQTINRAKKAAIDAALLCRKNATRQQEKALASAFIDVIERTVSDRDDIDAGSLIGSKITIVTVFNKNLGTSRYPDYFECWTAHAGTVSRVTDKGLFLISKYSNNESYYSFKKTLAFLNGEHAWKEFC